MDKQKIIDAIMKEASEDCYIVTEDMPLKCGLPVLTLEKVSNLLDKYLPNMKKGVSNAN